MTSRVSQAENAGPFSSKQRLFFKYTLFILVDLTVLNLFEQYWEVVYIENFTISLAVAVLLQFLLKVTIAIEHKVADYFKKKSGFKAGLLRGLSTWGILFGSKLIMLEAIDWAFGSSVVFGGPIHGLVAFIFIVIAMIVAEQAFSWVFRSLA